MVKVEECAKAACKAAWIESGEDWSLAGDEQKDEFRRITRAVLTCLLDDPTMSRETRRHLDAILSEGTDNG